MRYNGLPTMKVTDIKKVLLVDDDEAIRIICRLTLSTVGNWQVVETASGQEALEKAASEKPDLILLDVMMPGMDGITTLQRLKDDARAADIPVIFITARVQKSQVKRYLELGAKGVISKPFDPMALPEQILRILGAE